MDLADYLIKFDYRKFKIQSTAVIQGQNKVERLPSKRNSEQKPIPKGEKGAKSEGLNKHFFSQSIKKEQPETWEKKIAELEHFFKTVTLPTKPVKLNQCSTITDINKFINSHLPIVKAHDGNQGYKPYYDRLLTLKNILN